MVIDRRRKFLEDLQLIRMAEPPNSQIGFPQGETTVGESNPADIPGPSIFNFGDIIRGAVSQKVGTVGPDDIYGSKITAGKEDTLPEAQSIINEFGTVVHTGERSSRGLSSRLTQLQTENPDVRYRVVADIEVPNFLDRFRSLDANQKRIIQPLNMTGTKPDIFKRVTSGVAEDVFNQSIVDTVADVRFDSNNKNQSGKPVIRNFDYYNDTYKLDLPDVPFSAYGQGEKLLSFFGPTYQDARKYTEAGSNNRLLASMFPESKIAGNIIDKVYQPLYSFVKRKITGSENQRISKAFIDDDVKPKIPGTHKTDLENVNDMLFWEAELTKQLESAINLRDKLINSPQPTSADQQAVNASELQAYNARIAELPNVIMANRAMLAKAYETGNPTIQDKIDVVQSDGNTQELLNKLDTSNLNKNKNKFNLKKRKRRY